MAQTEQNKLNTGAAELALAHLICLAAPLLGKPSKMRRQEESGGLLPQWHCKEFCSQVR